MMRYCCALVLVLALFAVSTEGFRIKRKGKEEGTQFKEDSHTEIMDEEITDKSENDNDGSSSQFVSSLTQQQKSGWNHADLYAAVTSGQDAVVQDMLGSVTDEHIKKELLQKRSSSRKYEEEGWFVLPPRNTTLFGAVIIEQAWCDGDCDHTDGLWVLTFYLGCLYTELGLSTKPADNGYSGIRGFDEDFFGAAPHLLPMCSKCVYASNFDHCASELNMWPYSSPKKLYTRLVEAVTAGQHTVVQDILGNVTDEHTQKELLQKRSSSRKYKGKQRYTTLFGAVVVEMSWCDWDCSHDQGLWVLHLYLGCLYTELGLSTKPEENGFSDLRGSVPSFDRYYLPMCSKCAYASDVVKCFSEPIYR